MQLDTPPGPTTGQRETVVFRTIPIPVSAFDWLKDFQRATQARTGQRLTFNEAFALMVHQHKQHQQNADNGSHRHEQAPRTRTAAILR